MIVNYAAILVTLLLPLCSRTIKKLSAVALSIIVPRGITSSGVEESGAIVTVGAGARKEANVRATTQELYHGLSATGQNAWPNVRFDLGSTANYFSRFLGAGFYYKTFMGIPPFEWGRGTQIWMFYEKYIRKAAGMGTASRQPDPDNYEHAHGFCDAADHRIWSLWFSCGLEVIRYKSRRNVNRTGF